MCCAFLKIYFKDKHITSPIIKYNIIQRAKSEIDNTLLKDEDFHKYLLYHTIFYFILKRNKSSNFHTLEIYGRNFFSVALKRTSKIGDHIATINNTVAVELRIGGIFLHRNRPTLGHQLQSQNL